MFFVKKKITNLRYLQIKIKVSISQKIPMVQQNLRSLSSKIKVSKPIKKGSKLLKLRLNLSLKKTLLLKYCYTKVGMSYDDDKVLLLPSIVGHQKL